MKILIPLLAIFISINCFSQYSWDPVADFAPGNRYSAASFSVNNKGYLVAGRASYSNHTYFNDVWEYDPVNDTWTQKANFPGIPRDGAASFVINGKAYVGAGCNENVSPKYYNDFYEYDPMNNTWTQKDSFPGTPRYLGISFSINGKGYFGTGYPGPKDDFWEYNPATDSWTQVASFPGGPRMCLAYFTIGGKGYAGTGMDNFVSEVDFYEYDPTLNVWTQKANFGGLPRYAAVGFEINGIGFIGTGGTFNGSTYSFHTDFWKYDPVINSWSPAPNFVGNSRYVASTFVINDTAYLGTGGNNSASYQDVWRFTSIPTGQEEHLSKKEIIIYPNPASNSISIKGELQGNEWNISVMDIKGSVVLKTTVSSLNTTLDITTLSSGFYILSISDGSSIVHQTKFEKIK